MSLEVRLRSTHRTLHFATHPFPDEDACHVERCYVARIFLPTPLCPSFSFFASRRSMYRPCTLLSPLTPKSHDNDIQSQPPPSPVSFDSRNPFHFHYTPCNHGPYSTDADHYARILMLQFFVVPYTLHPISSHPFPLSISLYTNFIDQLYVYDIERLPSSSSHPLSTHYIL